MTFLEVLAKMAGQPVVTGPATASPRGGRAGSTAEGAERPGADLEGGRRPLIEEPSQQPEPDGDRKGLDSAPSTGPAPGLVHGLLVDPFALILSAASGLGTEPPAPSGTAALPFAELWGRLVRRVAWGGDARRGTARIEIGAGEWAGAAIVVHAVERQVAVEIELPAGARVDSWRERIAERLRERGLVLSELTIR